MAIFDRLGALVGSAKLNGELSGRKKRLDRLYADLGRAYYTRRREAPPPEDGELFGEIGGVLAEIAEREASLEALRASRQAPAGVCCPSCGGPTLPGDRFCVRCGARLAPAETEPVEAPEEAETPETEETE